MLSMNRGAIEKNKGRCHELLILAFVHLAGINLISKSLRKDPGEFVLASPAHTFFGNMYMYIHVYYLAFRWSLYNNKYRAPCVLMNFLAPICNIQWESMLIRKSVD